MTAADCQGSDLPPMSLDPFPLVRAFALPMARDPRLAGLRLHPMPGAPVPLATFPFPVARDPCDGLSRRGLRPFFHSGGGRLCRHVGSSGARCEDYRRNRGQGNQTDHIPFHTVPPSTEQFNAVREEFSYHPAHTGSWNNTTCGEPSPITNRPRGQRVEFSAAPHGSAIDEIGPFVLIATAGCITGNRSGHLRT
jgi:hypothetical protein